MIRPGRRISRAFIAAVIGAVAVVLPDPKNLHSWASGLGIIAAAVSGGATKEKKQP